MAYGQNSRNHICFKELPSVIYEEDFNQTLADFVVQHDHHLPIIMRITGGYSGQSMEYSFDDKLFVTHVLTQKRVIVKDHFGQMLSFPADHYLKFFTLIDGVKSEESMKLGDIVDKEEVISSKKTELIPDPHKDEPSISFNVGDDASVTIQLGKMTFMVKYDERYIVGNPIVFEKLFKQPAAIHLWMDMNVDTAIGLKDLPREDLDLLVNNMKLQTNRLQNSKLPGNKEIMLFLDDIGDYEGVYDIIIPRNKEYGHLPPQRESDDPSQPKPQPLPRAPVTDQQAQKHRKAPRPPIKKSETLIKGITGWLKSKKKTKSTSDAEDNKSNVQEAVHPQANYEYVDENKMDLLAENSSDDDYTMPFPDFYPAPPRSNNKKDNLYSSDSAVRDSSISVETIPHTKTKFSIEYEAKPITTQRRHDMYEDVEKEDLKNELEQVLSKAKFRCTDKTQSKPDTSGTLSKESNQGASHPVESIANISDKPVVRDCNISIAKEDSKPAPNPTEIYMPQNDGTGPKMASLDSTEEAEYVSYSQLPKRVNGMSVKQICDCLKLLKMDQHIENFTEQDVDGDLLAVMGRSEFEELGLSPLHITKMIKFQGGWRPNREDK